MRRSFPSRHAALSSATALLVILTGSGPASAQLSRPDTVSVQPSQAVTEDWRDADYGFAAKMMATDAAGDLYVVGDTAVGDYLVIKKINASGVLQWQATYDPVERLRGVWIAVDSGGNALVLASMVTGSSYQPAGWLTLKYGPDGALLWARPLPGAFRDARRLAIDADDAVYVAGRMWLTNPSGNTTHDSVLIKYAPDGTTLWTAVFDAASAIDEPFSLAVSPDGTRIGVAGISGNLFMALMYDRDGNRLWANTDGAAYAANDLAFGPGNVSYFATGTYLPLDPNPYQMAIRKFDAAGNPLSLRSYSVGDRAFRVRVDGQGNVVATGMDQAGYMDWITIKTDAAGTLLWSQRYDAGRNNDETPNMLVLDASGNVYVTGKGGPNPSTGTISYLKGVIVKYDAEGHPRWAVWDPYANGGSMSLGAGSTLASLSWSYLVAAHYTETGLSDVVPAAPSSLTGFATYGASGWEARLSFVDNASNEFWVEAERCPGTGCTNFTRVAQSRGEDATGLADATVDQGVTYTYRVAARGFMGLSGYSNTIQVAVPGGTAPPPAPSGLAAQPLAGGPAPAILLTWTNNSTNQDVVKVERCLGTMCQDFVQIAVAPGSATSMADTFLLPRTRYRYRVRAHNAGGDSPYSNIAGTVTSRR